MAGSGYLLDLLRTLLALGFVCVLMWLGARWLARRGFGVPQAGSGATLRVLRRVPLEPRKSLYLVAVGRRVLLIGTGDGGAPSLLAELDAAHIDAADQPTPAAGQGDD